MSPSLAAPRIVASAGRKSKALRPARCRVADGIDINRGAISSVGRPAEACLPRAKEGVIARRAILLQAWLGAAAAAVAASAGPGRALAEDAVGGHDFVRGAEVETVTFANPNLPPVRVERGMAKQIGSPPAEPAAPAAGGTASARMVSVPRAVQKAPAPRPAPAIRSAAAATHDTAPPVAARAAVKAPQLRVAAKPALPTPIPVATTAEAPDLKRSEPAAPAPVAATWFAPPSQAPERAAPPAGTAAAARPLTAALSEAPAEQTKPG
ncbi:MAG: hypothetical protein JO258_12330, partial [Alphaproteobacteria bacterium]|nr:hypothetical protein [Alphaproteobacteria bacterium]